MKQPDILDRPAAYFPVGKPATTTTYRLLLDPLATVAELADAQDLGFCSTMRQKIF
jgi:hypothetical protein